ncbi:ABC transporter permease [Paenibacillus sp. GCM10027627]|uniref:ABC transporter permease n=1 Tax=unclassified Paenibacillus TaxID=185978 RepID=UPI0036417E80
MTTSHSGFAGAGKFAALLHKEWLELSRSFKLVWVPLVFIVLGVMQPVTSYFMPEIIEKAGNMPEGAVIEIPLPSGAEVLAGTLSQFGMMGVLILVLASMGAVSGERNSGAATLTWVKPISFLAYIGSKWTSMVALSLGSLLAGYAAAWYYTVQLFEGVDPAAWLASYALFGFWLAFIMSVTLLFSSLLRSPPAAAFSALGLAVLLSLSASAMPKYMKWSPGTLSGYASKAIMDGGFVSLSQVGWPLAVTAILMAGCLIGSSKALERTSSLD